MSRKIFLSFLGTGNYKPCKYVSKEKGESGVVNYVQDAIIDLYCKDFNKDDIAYIFLTNGAEEKNWRSLNNSFKKRDIRVEPVKEIPEGYSEEEIWIIFEKVFQVINENDEVILDITHGFRSLPMLEIVLLNYAKSLKNITVKAILYGAFEALGSAYNIDQRIPNPDNRKAPLLDLTAFSAIQAWTFAAQSFILTGKSRTITELSMDNINPILSETRGGDKTAVRIRKIMNALDQIEIAIATNRGRTIAEGNSVKTAKSEVGHLNENTDKVFAPIKPILRQILTKLGNFGKMQDWEAAVQWCIDHELIQQGITQLQEGIISFICELHQLKKSNLTDREIVAQALNILDQNIEETYWRPPAAEFKVKVKEIIDADFVKAHRKNYSALSKYRNDINHGGYKNGSIENGEKFKSKLDKIFNEFRCIRNECFDSN